MTLIRSGFTYLAERIARAIDVQNGQMPGTIADFTQPVLLSEDLTDQQFAWARRSSYFMSSDIGPAAGGASTNFLLRCKAANYGSQVLCRVRQVTVFAVGASPVVVAYQTGQEAIPVLTAAIALVPTAGDNRMYPKGVGTNSANGSWQLVSGYGAVTPVAGAGQWNRVVAPTAIGGTGNTAFVFDPLITLSAKQGGYLIFAAEQLGFNFGLGIVWEERQASPQELA